MDNEFYNVKMSLIGCVKFLVKKKQNPSISVRCSTIHLWCQSCEKHDQVTTNKQFHLFFLNCIGGVMVSMLPSSVVDQGFKRKTIKCVFVASTLSTQQ